MRPTVALEGGCVLLWHRAEATARRTGDRGPVQTVEGEAMRSEPLTSSHATEEPR